jgi:hypothetical protein
MTNALGSNTTISGRTKSVGKKAIYEPNDVYRPDLSKGYSTTYLLGRRKRLVYSGLSAMWVRAEE